MGSIGQEITLDASLSYDLENNVAEEGYKWYSNEVLIGNGKRVRYTFPKGEHVVTLMIVDLQGLSSEDNVRIAIRDKFVCKETNTKYFPEDTLCNKGWPSNEGEQIKINSYSYSCDTFEVCSEGLDPIIEDAMDCCSGTLTDPDKINACNYANQNGINTKSCQAIYIIKSLGRSATYMKDYYDAEMCCKGVKELCPSEDYLYKALPLPPNLQNKRLKCADTLDDAPYGEWMSSTNLQLNNIALSEVPTHASLNILETGTCVDYSASVTTLLRKLGYAKDEVYTVEASNHAYNLVKLPLDKYYTIVDMTGNNEGLKLGKVPSGYDYCRNIINCYNDLGKQVCPSNSEINGCIGIEENIGRTTGRVGAKAVSSFKDLLQAIWAEITR